MTNSDTLVYDPLCVEGCFRIYSEWVAEDVYDYCLKDECFGGMDFDLKDIEKVDYHFYSANANDGKSVEGCSYSCINDCNSISDKAD